MRRLWLLSLPCYLQLTRNGQAIYPTVIIILIALNKSEFEQHRHTISTIDRTVLSVQHADSAEDGFPETYAESLPLSTD